MHVLEMQTAIGETTNLAFQFSKIYNTVELFMNIYSGRFFKKKRVRIKLGGNR